MNFHINFKNYNSDGVFNITLKTLEFCPSTADILSNLTELLWLTLQNYRIVTVKDYSELGFVGQREKKVIIEALLN